jgi:hypothetical protein
MTSFLAFREMDGARRARRPDYRDAEDRRGDGAVGGAQIDRVTGDGYAE